MLCIVYFFIVIETILQGRTKYPRGVYGITYGVIYHIDNIAIKCQFAVLHWSSSGLTK